MEEYISDHDVLNMNNILAGYGDWFSAQLYRLIAKADAHNRAKLRSAFPLHVQVYENYLNG